MPKINTILTYLAPSIIAFVILGIDIFVSHRINNSYFATNTGCGDKPSQAITDVLALIGLAIAVYGAVRAFKLHHMWIGAVAVIFSLLVVFAGLTASFILNYSICF